jgi:hypothetical protein
MSIYCFEIGPKAVEQILPVKASDEEATTTLVLLLALTLPLPAKNHMCDEAT